MKSGDTLNYEKNTMNFFNLSLSMTNNNKFDISTILKDMKYGTPRFIEGWLN